MAFAFFVVNSALYRQTAVPTGRVAHGDEELQSGGAGREQPLQNKTPLDEGEGSSPSEMFWFFCIQALLALMFNIQLHIF